MRRQRKHRHHPDIWRERHLAEKLGGRRWFATPSGVAAHDFWRAINAEMLRPHAVLTEADFIALAQRVWDDVPLAFDAPYVKGHIMGGIPEFETHSVSWW